jgi:cell division protease FtsH
MHKEISIGLGIAAVISLLLAGYDILPVLFLAALGVGLYVLAKNRGLVSNKSFDSNVGSGGYQISFNDIGGQDSAIQELREALDFIKNHHHMKHLGIRPLKGILLTGPPGTGKTLMAKAAANYTDAVFVATSGSEFIEMYASKMFYN